MNRRSFFGLSLALPAVAFAAPAARAAGLRISSVKDDPGEVLFGKSQIDGQRLRVYLDGVEQEWWRTADEAEGFVLRDVKSPNGGPAYNPLTEEWLTETMRGKVEIVFEDKAWLAAALLPSVA